jgi:hypothetical protein
MPVVGKQPNFLNDLLVAIGRTTKSLPAVQRAEEFLLPLVGEGMQALQSIPEGQQDPSLALAKGLMDFLEFGTIEGAQEFQEASLPKLAASGIVQPFENVATVLGPSLGLSPEAQSTAALIAAMALQPKGGKVLRFKKPAGPRTRSVTSKTIPVTPGRMRVEQQRRRAEKALRARGEAEEMVRQRVIRPDEVDEVVQRMVAGKLPPMLDSPEGKKLLKQVRDELDKARKQGLDVPLTEEEINKALKFIKESEPTFKRAGRGPEDLGLPPREVSSRITRDVGKARLAGVDSARIDSLLENYRQRKLSELEVINHLHFAKKNPFLKTKGAKLTPREQDIRALAEGRLTTGQKVRIKPGVHGIDDDIFTTILEDKGRLLSEAEGTQLLKGINSGHLTRQDAIRVLREKGLGDRLRFNTRRSEVERQRFIKEHGDPFKEPK